ncbi:uroporphyrinogen-III synthase [Gymnodinialimonas sp.]
MQVHQTPTLLLTRPRLASERFATGVQGADVVIAPLMEIIGTGTDIALDGVAGLILTSEAVVPFLPRTALPAYCVGPRTATAACAAGFKAEALGQDAEGLIQALAKLRPPGPLLHPHGTYTRGDVAGRLSALGLPTTGLAVYDQREVPPSPAFHAALTLPGLVVPLFSPRSARLFAAAAPSVPDTAQIIALSPAVVEALPDTLRAQTRIAEAPTGDAMRGILVSLGVKWNSP